MNDDFVALWNSHPWLRLGGTVLASLLLAMVVHRLVRMLLWRLSDGHPMAQDVLRRARAPMGWLVPLLVITLALRARPEARALGLASFLEPALVVALIMVATWLGVRAVGAMESYFSRRYPVDVSDNLHARRVLTQARVLGRTVTVVLILIGLAAALMTIPGVRQLGASLLASAGLAGLAVGLAAKPVLSNLIAGIQIALTQPIRIDDVVIVQNEFGRVEEITATYVVVRVWDERRIVVPLNWFMENPFQNWTRSSSQLIGSVYLWLDYRTPLAPLRQELERLCKADPEWDGRVAALQVTDTSERAAQVRVLVSADDSGQAWNVRCRVREGLIAFISEHYPESLPRLRGEWERPPGGADPDTTAGTERAPAPGGSSGRGGIDRSGDVVSDP